MNDNPLSKHIDGCRLCQTGKLCERGRAIWNGMVHQDEIWSMDYFGKRGIFGTT